MYNDVINEYCVSLDTARLLKEIGYNNPCIAYYRRNAFIPAQIYNNNITLGNYNDAPDYMEQYSAPTYDNAREWLEQVHHIGIIIIKILDTYEYKIYYDDDKYHDEIATVKGFTNYNDAYETAIRRCIIYSKCITLLNQNEKQCDAGKSDRNVDGCRCVAQQERRQGISFFGDDVFRPNAFHASYFNAFPSFILQISTFGGTNIGNARFSFGNSMHPCFRFPYEQRQITETKGQQ